MPEKKVYKEKNIIDLSKRCAEVLADKKANDIVLMDLHNVNSYLDYFIIATGNSLIHCSALAKEVQRFFHVNSLPGNSKPRLDSGWIILDYDELIIHIFTQELRDYYQLEKLWGDAEFIEYK